MAQTKGRPPTFVLFAARAYAMPDTYRRYLINSLRESFDLPGVPIRLTVKANANTNPYIDGDTSVDGKPAGFARVRKKPKVKPGEKPAHPNRVRQKSKEQKAAQAAKPAVKIDVKPRSAALKFKGPKSAMPSTKPGAAGPGGRARSAAKSPRPKR